MKIAVATFALWAGSALAAVGPLVPVASERTFVPQGFDDNDRTEIVIEGKLANDCYRLEDPSITVDAGRREIIVQPRASYYEWMCLEVQVPWTQVVNLGRLAAGGWTVKTGSRVDVAMLPVKSSSTVRPDDHVYAPVETLSIEVRDTLAVATIRGHFSSRCAILEDVRMIDSGRTIEVLPIMTPGSARGCEQFNTPFERQLILPQKSAGRYLVHVRSLNGQSLNQVYQIGE